jgi:hypothetical protein
MNLAIKCDTSSIAQDAGWASWEYIYLRQQGQGDDCDKYFSDCHGVVVPWETVERPDGV